MEKLHQVEPFITVFRGKRTHVALIPWQTFGEGWLVFCFFFHWRQRRQHCWQRWENRERVQMQEIKLEFVARGTSGLANCVSQVRSVVLREPRGGDLSRLGRKPFAVWVQSSAMKEATRARRGGGLRGSTQQLRQIVMKPPDHTNTASNVKMS